MSASESANAERRDRDACAVDCLRAEKCSPCRRCRNSFNRCSMALLRVLLTELDDSCDDSLDEIDSFDWDEVMDCVLSSLPNVSNLRALSTRRADGGRSRSTSNSLFCSSRFCTARRNLLDAKAPLAARWKFWALRLRADALGLVASFRVDLRGDGMTVACGLRGVTPRSGFE